MMSNRDSNPNFQSKWEIDTDFEVSELGSQTSSLRGSYSTGFPPSENGILHSDRSIRSCNKMAGKPQNSLRESSDMVDLTELDDADTLHNTYDGTASEFSVDSALQEFQEFEAEVLEGRLPPPQQQIKSGGQQHPAGIGHLNGYVDQLDESFSSTQRADSETEEGAILDAYLKEAQTSGTNYMERMLSNQQSVSPTITELLEFGQTSRNDEMRGDGSSDLGSNPELDSMHQNHQESRQLTIQSRNRDSADFEVEHLSTVLPTSQYRPVHSNDQIEVFQDMGDHFNFTDTSPYENKPYNINGANHSPLYQSEELNVDDRWRISPSDDQWNPSQSEGQEEPIEDDPEDLEIVNEHHVIEESLVDPIGVYDRLAHSMAPGPNPTTNLGLEFQLHSTNKKPLVPSPKVSDSPIKQRNKMGSVPPTTETRTILDFDSNKNKRSCSRQEVVEWLDQSSEKSGSTIPGSDSQSTKRVLSSKPPSHTHTRSRTSQSNKNSAPPTLQKGETFSSTESEEAEPISGLSDSKASLVDKLKKEKTARKEQDDLISQMQLYLHNLMTKHALAEVTIDQLRMGVKVPGRPPHPITGEGRKTLPANRSSLPKSSSVGNLRSPSLINRLSLGDFTSSHLSPRQPPPTNSRVTNITKDSLTGSPLSLPGSPNQYRRRVLPSGTSPLVTNSTNQSNISISNAHPQPQLTEEFLANLMTSESPESRQLGVMLRANGLEEAINWLSNKMTSSDSNSVDQSVKEDEIAVGELRRVYDQLQDDYKIAQSYDRNVGATNSSTLENDDFDTDHQLEGFVFQLGMRLDEIEETVNTNVRSANRRTPFRSVSYSQENLHVASSSSVATVVDGGTTNTAFPLSKPIGRLSRRDLANHRRDGNTTPREISELNMSDMEENYIALMDRYNRVKTMQRTPSRDRELGTLKRHLLSIAEEAEGNSQLIITSNELDQQFQLDEDTRILNTELEHAVEQEGNTGPSSRRSSLPLPPGLRMPQESSTTSSTLSVARTIEDRFRQSRGAQQQPHDGSRRSSTLSPHSAALERRGNGATGTGRVRPSGRYDSGGGSSEPRQYGGVRDRLKAAEATSSPAKTNRRGSLHNNTALNSTDGSGISLPVNTANGKPPRNTGGSQSHLGMQRRSSLAMTATSTIYNTLRPVGGEVLSDSGFVGSHGDRVEERGGRPDSRGIPGFKFQTNNEDQQVYKENNQITPSEIARDDFIGGNNGLVRESSASYRPRRDSLRTTSVGESVFDAENEHRTPRSVDGGDSAEEDQIRDLEEEIRFLKDHLHGAGSEASLDEPRNLGNLDRYDNHGYRPRRGSAGVVGREWRGGGRRALSSTTGDNSEEELFLAKEERRRRLLALTPRSHDLDREGRPIARNNFESRQQRQQPIRGLRSRSDTQRRYSQQQPRSSTSRDRIRKKSYQYEVEAGDFVETTSSIEDYDTSDHHDLPQEKGKRRERDERRSDSLRLPISRDESSQTPPLKGRSVGVTGRPDSPEYDNFKDDVAYWNGASFHPSRRPILRKSFSHYFPRSESVDEIEFNDDDKAYVSFDDRLDRIEGSRTHHHQHSSRSLVVSRRSRAREMDHHQPCSLCRGSGLNDLNEDSYRYPKKGPMKAVHSLITLDRSPSPEMKLPLRNYRCQGRTRYYVREYSHIDSGPSERMGNAFVSVLPQRQHNSRGTRHREDAAKRRHASSQQIGNFSEDSDVSIPRHVVKHSLDTAIHVARSMSALANRLKTNLEMDVDPPGPVTDPYHWAYA